MSNWPTKKLGEVLEINYGKGLPKDSRVDSGKYFAYGSNGPVYSTNESLTNGEIIVIGRKGTAGALYFTSEPCWPIDTTFFAKPKNNASLKFVYYLLQTKRLPRLAIVTGVPGINRTTLANIKIQLPPLTTQNQIVERLDKIAEAQKLNDELIQKTDELFQSLLHKELNPASKNWEIKKLGEVCEKTKQGNPKNFFKNEFRYIDISSINAEAKEIQNANLISVEGAPSRARKLVKAGDIVFATTRPYLENIAIVPAGLGDAIASTGFCVIRANTKMTDQDFLYFTVISKPFIKKVLSFQRGANYPAVSDKDIFGIKIPVPPLKTQKQIVSKLSAVQDYKKQLLEQKAKLKELFDSALAKSMSNK